MREVQSLQFEAQDSGKLAQHGAVQLAGACTISLGASKFSYIQKIRHCLSSCSYNSCNQHQPLEYVPIEIAKTLQQAQELMHKRGLSFGLPVESSISIWD